MGCIAFGAVVFSRSIWLFYKPHCPFDSPPINAKIAIGLAICPLEDPIGTPMVLPLQYIQGNHEPLIVECRSELQSDHSEIINVHLCVRANIGDRDRLNCTIT